MTTKKTVVVKVPEDQVKVRKQLVSNLKHDYHIIFLPEDMDMDEFAFKIIQCDDSDLPIETVNEDEVKNWYEYD